MIRILFTAAFLMPTFAAQANENCEILFRAFQKKEDAFLTQTLQLFDSTDLGPRRIGFVSKGSISVPLGSEFKGILRTHNNNDALSFEMFVTDFLRQAPHVHLSPIERLQLDRQDRALLSQAAADAGADQLSAQLSASELQPVSIRLLMPGTNGSDFINHEFGTELRNLLSDQANSGQSESADFKQNLELYWQILPPEGRQLLQEDLIEYGIPVSATVESNFVTSVPSEMHKFPKDYFVELSSYHVFKHLPRELQTQIADHWALFYTLGGVGYWPSHWNVNQNNPAGRIQTFWYRGSDGRDVGPLTLARGRLNYPRHNPIGVNKLITKRLLAALEQAVSPEMKSFLAKLTEEQILIPARTNGVSLTEEEVQGIQHRGYSFIRKTLEGPNNPWTALWPARRELPLRMRK